jgi:hypothetical protein
MYTAVAAKLGALAGQGSTMEGNTAASRLFIELTAHVADREIPRSGAGSRPQM